MPNLLSRFFLKEIHSYLFLFLLLLNFLGLWPYWLVLFVLFSLFNVKLFLHIDVNNLWITLYYISYAFFNYYNSFGYSVFNWISTLLGANIMYLTGKYYVNKYGSTKFIFLLSLTIVFVFSLIPFISNLLDVLSNGFMNNRNIHLLWVNSKEVNATNVGSYFALNMVLFVFIFVYQEEITLSRGRKNLYILFLFGIGLFSILNMSNRTGLILTILSISFSLLTISSDKYKNIFKVIITILFLLVIIAWLGLLDSFSKSYIYERIFVDIDISNESSIPRLTGWLITSQDLFNFPFGGEKAAIFTSYAHNLWLDVGRRTGLIPLSFLLIITLNYSISIIKIWRNDRIDNYLKLITINFSVAFLGTFMVEPINYGYLRFFLLFFFFYGIFYQIYKTYT